MTNPNYTHITVLLDESGSMERLAEDTRGGFNTFLKEQKEVEGKATMTVCKFAGGYEVLAAMKDIKKVKALTGATYRPSGGTALLDAMGKCITDLGKALAELSEEDRPGKVLFLIITDGEENASQEWSKAKIAEMVKTQEEVYKWNFMYLGANVDAFHESAALGIRASNAIGYTASSKGMHQAYTVMSASLGAVRGLNAQDMSLDMFSSNHVDELENVDFAQRLSTQVTGNTTGTPTPVDPATPPPADNT